MPPTRRVADVLGTAESGLATTDAALAKAMDFATKARDHAIAVADAFNGMLRQMELARTGSGDAQLALATMWDLDLRVGPQHGRAAA